jgi:1-deoxy-D-xylulose-5-phosphate reductoisomerase
MKRIAILGSTGSIGVQSLDVIARFPDRFRVTGLTANSQTERLAAQIATFHPPHVAVAEERYAHSLKQRVGHAPVHTGVEGLIEVVTAPDVDLVISALPGNAGFLPTLRAIEAGKTIALANKEILVMAGAIVRKAALKHGVDILPVDSEHSAIHQCLAGQPLDRVHRLILTASGGPFLHTDPETLEAMSPREALAHPTWAMGKKVTIDSATLMNKGFEVIEAHWLFDMPFSKIDVVIHPQSVIHSMVEMVDGSILAQLGAPDMRLPIQYALTYPDRLGSAWPRFDLSRGWNLTLMPPDTRKFPCLALAYEAGQAGGVTPATLSAADEVAVAAFLESRIRFTQIPQMIADAMKSHANGAASDLTLESVMTADARTRRYCEERIGLEK